MNRKAYVSPYTVICILEKHDVITTSGDNDVPWDDNWTDIY